MAFYRSSSVVCILLQLCLGQSEAHGPPEAYRELSPSPKIYNTNTKISNDLSVDFSNRKCDDAKWNILLDWDDTTDFEFRCQDDERKFLGINEVKHHQECLLKKDIPRPLHICMNKRIEYLDTPPMAGPHRPQWPEYGEYSYVPPQRWVHSLEHGAAVFLYHPCADPDQVDILKGLARRCLRKHIITPYRKFSGEMLFAVVTYGCRLQMNTVDQTLAETFVREHALQAPEGRVARNGQYDHGMLHAADLVSDVEDSILCPELIAKSKNKSLVLMIAEKMTL